MGGSEEVRDIYSIPLPMGGILRVEETKEISEEDQILTLAFLSFCIV